MIEFDEYGIQMSAPNTSVLWSGPVLCNVVSSTLIADNRWRYRLAQCGIESGTGGGVRVEGAAGYFDNRHRARVQRMRGAQYVARCVGDYCRRLAGGLRARRGSKWGIGYGLVSLRRGELGRDFQPSGRI